MEMVKDLLVKTGNPQYLDETLQQFGAVVITNTWDAATGVCAVRCLPPTQFKRKQIEFILKNQGYGQVVGDTDEYQVKIENPEG